MSDAPGGRLAGRACLITGSTGIAAASAELFADEGAAIFVISRTEANCRDLVERLRARGARADYRAADLSKEAAAVAAVAAAIESLGQIDAVFNVAGISGRRFGDGPIHEATEQGWDTTLDTNAKSAFFICRETIKHMLGREVLPGQHRGAILNMASVLGYSPSPRLFGTHAYAASKAAIIGLSHSIAAYYAPHGIRVNAIAPALVRTPMSRRAQDDPTVRRYVQRKQPLVSGMLEPIEVATAALFLLSDEARAISGQVIAVDGGWTIAEASVD